MKRVSQDLLIGFDPVAVYLGLLRSRYGHLGMFCADNVGGVAIGVKWDPQAFVPLPLDPETAHTAVPVARGIGFDGRRGSGVVKLVVPDVPQVLREITELGSGLVLSVKVRDGNL